MKRLIKNLKFLFLYLNYGNLSEYRCLHCNKFKVNPTGSIISSSRGFCERSENFYEPTSPYFGICENFKLKSK